MLMLSIIRPGKFPPKVVWTVFVGNNDDRELLIVLDRVGSVGSIRKMLLDVRNQALQCGFAAKHTNVRKSTVNSFSPALFGAGDLRKFGLWAGQHMALDRAGLLRLMVEGEAC